MTGKDIWSNVYGITGWKNSGKTTLMENIIKEFVSRGMTVNAMKHASDDFHADREGTDSWRFGTAGAGEVLVSSSRRWALIHNNTYDEYPQPDDMLRKLSPADIVLVEGWKNADFPKIEVYRHGVSKSIMAGSIKGIRAIASSPPMPEYGNYYTMDVNNFKEICNFIVKDLFITAGGHGV